MEQLPLKVNLTEVRTTLTHTVSPTSAYTLTIAKTGTGSGTVTSSPAGINCGSDCSHSYISGTVVTLSARRWRCQHQAAHLPGRAA